MEHAQRIDDLPVQVDVQAVLAQLRIGSESPAVSRVKVLADRMQDTVRPRALYRPCDVESNDRDVVRIGGVEFTSRTLAALLNATRRVFAYVVTCGSDAEFQLPSDSGAFERVALDAITNQLLRQGCLVFEKQLSQRYGLGQTATIGPGAGDGILWPVEQQRALFELLGDTQASIGVTLTEDYMMLPMKSLSGLLFTTDSGFRSCQLCTSPDCGMRDASFDQCVRDGLADGKPMSAIR